MLCTAVYLDRSRSFGKRRTKVTCVLPTGPLTGRSLCSTQRTKMSAAGERRVLLKDQLPREQLPEESLVSPSQALDDCSTRLSTFSEHLGIRIDALSSSDPAESSRGSRGSSSAINRRADEPVLVVTQEKVENLISTLETTSEALKRLVLDSHGLLTKTRRHRHRMPRWVADHLLAITIIWQVLHITALTVLEEFLQVDKDGQKIVALTVVIMVLFQASNLLLVIFSTIKLSKQIMHLTVTKSFFGQSYLSTILLYAGLYTLVYKIKHGSFDNLHGLDPDDGFVSAKAFIKLLFFSVSNATLCGSAAIVADAWYAQLICSTQMLFSYVYFASVMYLAVHPPKKELRYKVARNRDSTMRMYGTINSV